MSSDALFRVLVVAVVVGLALGSGTLWRRRARPRQRPVDVVGLGLPAGLVIFTSTACGNCAAARHVVEGLALPVREVTWELEPATFEEAGVEAVPLVLVIDAAGRAVAQFSGVPSRTALRAAAGKID